MSATASPLRAFTALLAGLCLVLSGLALDPAAAVGLAAVSGTVTDAESHAALPGAGVSLFVWTDHGGGVSSFDYLGTKLTGADGTYTWPGLDAGAYYARVAEDGYAVAYSGTATTDPLTPDQAGVFELADGDNHHVDVALDPAAGELGTLAGTVTDSDGAPVDALQVEAVPAGQTQSVNLGYTVAGGFALHVPAGDYSLRFHDVSNRFPDRDLDGPFTVTSRHTTTVPPVTLAVPDKVTATGTVAQEDGGPLAGADVTLWRVLGSGADAGLAYVGHTTADAAGTFELTGLGKGLTYTVEAAAGGHRSRFLGDRADGSSADVFEARDTNPLATIHLPLSNHVSGVVSGTGAAGPLAGVKVTLMRWTVRDGRASFLPLSDYTLTGPDGSFTISDIDPGSYTLYAEPPEGGTWDTAYLGDGSLPPGAPQAAGTFQVATPASDVAGQDITLSRRLHGAGHVASAAGALAGATVTAYRWDQTAGAWDEYDETTTDAAGDYDLRLPHHATVAVSAVKNRYARQFVGGGSGLPAAPGTGDHLTTEGSDVSVAPLVLTRRPSDLGKRAGQDLEYCYDRDLPTGSDASSGAVPLPAGLPLRFFGRAYEEVHVNDNGNITFGADNTTFTPQDLRTTDVPVIAPYWADMDARGNDVSASYGFSPDGRRLCVVWTDMGFYDAHSDRLNTVQLLLTSADGDPGRSTGDFDITFDYDTVTWDAGDFDGGVDGLAAATGHSAVAGFSAGTGAPGTWFQLDGSLVPGSLVDDGPNALVAGTAAATTPGRYVFQVRNDGTPGTAGTVAGMVTDQYGRVLEDATATLLRSDSQDDTGVADAGGPQHTGASGEFSWEVPPGWYRVDGTAEGCTAGGTARVRVPIDRRGLVAKATCAGAPAPVALSTPAITGAARVDATLTAIAATWPAPLQYLDRQWLRNGTPIPGATGTSYTPTPADLGATLSVRETAARPATTVQGTTVTFASVDAVSSGVAVGAGSPPVAEVAPGLTGTARVGRTLTATPGSWSRPALSFDYAWLRDGAAIPGATGPTRTLTSADRGAALSVRVTASQTGFASGTATSASTVVAAGDAPATTSVPRVVGRAAAGQRLVADAGSWTGTGWSFRYQWLRDGTPVDGADGAAYTPGSADIGRALSVRVTAGQAGFDPGTATAAAVTVDRYASSTKASWVKRKVRTGKAAKLRVKVSAEGLSAPTGKVRVVLRGHVVRKTSLDVGDAGRVTARLRGLRPGRYRVRADYAGTKVVAPSRSATVVLRVR